MSRLTITTTALAATAALALPGAATAAPVDAAAHLEASAVVNSAGALDQVGENAAKAKRAIQRSELALKRAYRIARDQGLDASAKFAASADAQGDNLSAIVEQSNGSLKSAAAKALARTTQMEADLVARSADGLDDQQQSASAAQSEDVSSLGEDHASLTATIAVTASDAGIRAAVQRQMDTATAASVKAQADLVEAVDNLRKRSEGQGQSAMVSLQASLERSGKNLADALESSGRWDVSYEKTVGTGEGPVSATATVQAHAVVDHGGRR
jgi:hypothetical protein